MSKSNHSDKRGNRYNKRGRNYNNRKHDNRRVLKNMSFQQIQPYFAACSCCGYFLTGYRVIHGVESIDQAGRAMTDGWITLIWDQKTRALLNRTYDMRTDIETFHFESTCSECQRKIVFAGDIPTEEGSEEIEKETEAVVDAAESVEVVEGAAVEPEAQSEPSEEESGEEPVAEQAEVPAAKILTFRMRVG